MAVESQICTTPPLFSRSCTQGPLFELTPNAFVTLFADVVPLRSTNFPSQAAVTQSGGKWLSLLEVLLSGERMAGVWLGFL